MRYLLSVALGTLLAVAQGTAMAGTEGPSPSPYERMLATSEKFSELDAKLNSIYWLVEAVGGHHPVEEQRPWLKQRDKCTNSECVFALYNSRIRDLYLLTESKLEPLPSTVKWAKHNTYSLGKGDQDCDDVFWGRWTVSGDRISGSMEAVAHCGNKVDDRDFAGQIEGKIAYIALDGPGTTKPGLAMFAYSHGLVYFRIVRDAEYEWWGSYLPESTIAPLGEPLP